MQETDSILQWVLAVMLDDEDAAFVFECRANSKELENGRIVSRIRRIKESHVPQVALIHHNTSQEIYRITQDYFRLSFRHSATFEVHLDKVAHLRRAINEGHVRRSARQSLDADRARTRAEINEARFDNPLSQKIEESFTQPPRRWPRSR